MWAILDLRIEFYDFLVFPADSLQNFVVAPLAQETRVPPLQRSYPLFNDSLLRNV
jgi:hypothetical protein